MANSTQVSLHSNLTTTESNTAENNDDKKRIIAIVVVLCALALTCVISYLLYRKICKSHHNKHKHGVAGKEAAGRRKGKVEYYDQFGCDTNELTINSVTAITWDDESKKRKRVDVTGSSSGVDCDSGSEDPKDSKIITGKRVFQVHKVSEKASKNRPAGQVVIRLNKSFTDAARSLQASDGRNYSLALIDQNSRTVHNIDLDRKKLPRAKSPLIGASEPGPQPMFSGQLRPLDSSSHSAGPAACSCTDEMVHDSPDLVRRGKVSISVDEITCGSDDSIDKVKDRQSSLSSEEVDCSDSTAKLLHVTAEVSS